MLASISWLDRLLLLWIVMVMASGHLLMKPVLAKVRYGELGHVASDLRLLRLAMALVWGLGPLLMFTLAWLFLPDQPAFRTGLILIGIAPCIAMVLIWIDLALGDREAAALLVAINLILQVLIYALLGTFYVCVQGMGRSQRESTPGRYHPERSDHRTHGVIV